MPKGVSGKGYKMTAGRKAVLELLIEEGGALKSSEGRASSLLHGLLGNDTSLASLNACLKELQNLEFISRNIDGRRTYEISITDRGREVYTNETGLDATPTTPVEFEPEVIEVTAVDGDWPPADLTETESEPSIGPVPEEEWDWQAAEVEQAPIPDGIDYDILCAVFVKAALRGMEGPSNNEVDYLKQQLVHKEEKISTLEEQVNRYRAEAAQKSAEVDQLQKNLNIVMSRAEKVGAGRGSDPIRKLLKPEELASLDQLMRQIPTRKGD